jgi:hypothetical protein
MSKKFDPTFKMIDSNMRRANDHLIKSSLKERSNSQVWPLWRTFTDNSNWVEIGFETKAGNTWSGKFVALTPWHIVVNFDSRSTYIGETQILTSLGLKPRSIEGFFLICTLVSLVLDPNVNLPQVRVDTKNWLGWSAWTTTHQEVVVETPCQYTRQPWLEEMTIVTLERPT